MILDESSEGRPLRLSAACRKLLRDPSVAGVELDAAARDHLGSCAFCAARAAARDRLGAMIAQRPPMPDNLVVASWLQQVHARVVMQAEESALGRMLASEKPAPMSEGLGNGGRGSEGFGWPESLLDSELGRRTLVPPRSSPAAWAQVRQSILADVVGSPADTRWRLMLGATAMVLVAVGCLVWFHQGTTKPPDVVFADLVSMPDVVFSVVRHGVLR